MSSHCNPNIVEDGLVFLYDVDDIQSYKGEPTTNVMADPLPTAGWGVSNYLSSTATRTYSSENGIPHMEITNVNVDGSYPRINMANLTSTITDGFSISFEAKSSVADAQLYFALYSSGSTKTSQLATLSTEWQRFKFENLTTGFTLDDGYLRFPSSADSGTVYYIRRMQVEQKSHATPFVNGTRSATQGLIDRTGNSTIDLSNVSFDSNAQMTFDGTDDYGTITDSTLFDFGTGNFSMEAVVKGTNTSNYRAIFYHHYNSGFVYITNVTTGVMRVWIDLKVLNGNTNILDGNYHHTAFVRQGDTLSLYVDGELDASSTGWFSKNATNTSKGASIGRYIDGSTNYPWNGEILSLKAYNKALTSTEVLQNYKSTKSRFNL